MSVSTTVRARNGRVGANATTDEAVWRLQDGLARALAIALNLWLSCLLVRSATKGRSHTRKLHAPVRTDAELKARPVLVSAVPRRRHAALKVRPVHALAILLLLIVPSAMGIRGISVSGQAGGEWRVCFHKHGQSSSSLSTDRAVAADTTTHAKGQSFDAALCAATLPWRAANSAGERAIAPSTLTLSFEDKYNGPHHTSSTVSDALTTSR